MEFNELKGAAREAYLSRQIRELRNLYTVQQRKLRLLLQGTDLTSFSRVRAESILKQVDQIVEGLNRGAYNWARQTMPVAYHRGLDLTAERLKQLGVTRFVSPTAQVHTAAINILVDDVTSSLLVSNDGIKKFMNGFIRHTQQKILEDQAISKMIADGLITGSARRTVSDTLLNNFRQKLKEERFIVVNGRNYNPAHYSEMVARTRTKEATTNGTINTSLRYGVDLVQIDTHAEVCEYCQQFSGRVYSISGNDTDFPKLDQQPPFHPNCVCTLIPVTRRSLESRGYLNEIVKLSNSPETKIDSFSRFEETLVNL